MVIVEYLPIGLGLILNLNDELQILLQQALLRQKAHQIMAKCLELKCGNRGFFHVPYADSSLSFQDCLMWIVLSLQDLLDQWVNLSHEMYMIE